MLQRIDCGELVRRLRRAGKTDKAIGQLVGLSQPTVSRLATGKVRSTSGEVMVALIEACGGEVMLPADPTPAAPVAAVAEDSNAA